MPLESHTPGASEDKYCKTDTFIGWSWNSYSDWMRKYIYKWNTVPCVTIRVILRNMQWHHGYSTCETKYTLLCEALSVMLRLNPDHQAYHHLSFLEKTIRRRSKKVKKQRFCVLVVRLEICIDHLHDNS